MYSAHVTHSMNQMVTTLVFLPQRYEEWKDKLPDTEWLKAYFPQSQLISEKFTDYWTDFKKSAARMQKGFSLPDAVSVFCLFIVLIS